MSRSILAVFSLWRREIVRFLRQPSRVAGALATPVLFWLLLGGGMSRSFTASGAGEGNSMNYLEYFFPGTLAMIVLFTAVFSTISVIEDRREGFLQGVLVAPVRRWTIVWGKVLGSATLACAQGLVFLCMARWRGSAWDSGPRS